MLTILEAILDYLQPFCDFLEKYAVLVFFTFCGIMMYIHLSTEVTIHICSVDNVTSYVNVEKPHNLLNVGECREKRMTYGEYNELKRTFKGSR